MMKATFDKVLASNQIYCPRTKLGRILFDRKWSQANGKYYAYKTAFAKKNKQRESMIPLFRWESFPSLEEVTSPELVFETPAEALQSITSASTELEAANIFDVEQSLREAWVNKIVENAPQDCKLIVIKGTQKLVYAENEDKFNTAVSEKRQASILLSGVSAIWVAFDPNQPYNTSTWAMEQKLSTVEYVC